MTVLSRRALNRALLARQLLLERTSIPVPDVVEHLLGLQAQAPMPPYYGLWSRLTDFDPHAARRACSPIARRSGSRSCAARSTS